jgi:hypothetical protein
MYTESMTTTEQEVSYRDIDEITAANRRAGYHFFAADTKRFFGSRVGDTVYGGRFFVTSERTGWDHDASRAYTVREAQANGSIDTVGDFGQHATRQAAHRAAQRMAR